MRAEEWAMRISKAYIDFSIQTWKIRCQIEHARSVGTSDHAFCLSSKEMLKKLKKVPWQLQYQDRHLIQRSNKFIDKAPIATVKMWRKRLQVSMNSKEERTRVIGSDMNNFEKKRERLEEIRIYSIPRKRQRKHDLPGRTGLEIVQQLFVISCSNLLILLRNSS